MLGLLRIFSWLFMRFLFLFLCIQWSVISSFFSVLRWKQSPLNRNSKWIHGASLIQEKDSEVFSLIDKEWQRQKNSLELIASENYVSSSVLSALGSCLTNKYSEGQPFARYYGGNQHIDELEVLCQKRALDLFHLNPEGWSVNVQSYSGTPANFAVYTALLQPHDRIMGLDLPSGGHLSHGYQTSKRKISASSIFFESMPYTVNPDTGLIDYDEMEKLAKLFKPKLLIAGASSYPRDWDYARMKAIASSINAYFMVDISHIAGFVATKLHNDPFPHCDVITTTTHKSLRGPRAALIYSKKVLSEKINLGVFPGLQGGPHNHQIAAMAVALKEAKEEPVFRNYLQQVLLNTQTLVKELKDTYHYDLVANGSDNHMLVWDIRKPCCGLSASKLEKILEFVSISVNKNFIPSDSQAQTTGSGSSSVMIPHGIRLGTLAMTTRGMKEKDMKTIAGFLSQVVEIVQRISLEERKKSLKEFLHDFYSSENYDQIRKDLGILRGTVEEFSGLFPIPGQAYLI
jgi:glycine hydroxymethyltransferase